MSASDFRWAAWPLLLVFAVCNVIHSQEPEGRVEDATAIPNPRVLAADEAKAIKELQRLAQSDPSRIHATTLHTHNSMGWKWRVYLPPDKDWTIKGAVGRIPERGHLPHKQHDIVSQDIVRNDKSRIIALEGHISRAPFDNWLLLVEADRSVFSGVEFAAWDFERTPDSEEVLDYVTGKRAAASASYGSGDIGRVTTKINDDLKLVRWQFEPKVDPPAPGPDRRLPGFVLWIEAK